MVKEIDVTPSGLLSECRKGKFERGSTRYGWTVLIWFTGGHLHGRLSARGSPIMTLDHHFFPGEIPAGYHWDIMPPLSDPKTREWIDPQPPDEHATLELMFSAWSLQLEPEVQTRLPT